MRGRLGIWLATERGIGSVGRETGIGVLVTVASAGLVGWFCSRRTGWALRTLSGGKGWVGSCMGRAVTTGGLTGAAAAAGTLGAGLTCGSCLGGRTVGCGIPALGTQVLVITAARGSDWLVVTRVRVTEEGADSRTVCPVLGSINTS